MRIVIAALLTLAAPAAAAPAPTPADDFAALLADHWRWYLSTDPEQATDLGVRDFDARLPDLSLAEQDRQAAQAAAFLRRLDAIPPAALPAPDRVSHAVLRRLLRQEVEGNAFPQRAIAFTNRSGWHTSFANRPERAPFYTHADYDSYIARLEAYPAMNAQGVARAREGLRLGVAQPCAPFGGFERTITAQIVDGAEKSVFWRPFATRPTGVPAADWERLRARARTAIEGRVIPAYRDFAAFYRAEYAPKCRREVGIAATPRGAEYYAWRIRQQTTTELSADAIHRLGLSEVARIRAEMETVAKGAGFADRAAYVEHLRTDPRYYPKSPEELLAAAGALAKTIDGWMPKLFGRLPRLPYTVQPIPADQAPGNTTAYYNAGSEQTGRAGVYFVNTTELDQRPLFELPALGVHEAVPGHHHQIALQQELDLPMFRRHAAFFTAFVEGWGLYSERLGIEMGLYDTPAKNMGRLSYEMWRATRLVVDTGLHAKGWSKEQAVRYMLDNTALSAGNVDAEVNRYISWPGQALAYKLGELKIRELRTLAERELGAKFDLRGFHDAVLEQGAVPLDVLETQVRDWVAKTKG